MSDWANFSGGDPSAAKTQRSDDWANFGAFEGASPAPKPSSSPQRQPSPQQQPKSSPAPGALPPPSSSGSRRGGTLPGSSSQTHQLQQYRQRLVQMHQQLVNGQQQLKELNKHPDKKQQSQQLTTQLQQGLVQYQRLQQVVLQMQQQAQAQATTPTQSLPPGGQSPIQPVTQSTPPPQPERQPTPPPSMEPSHPPPMEPAPSNSSQVSGGSAEAKPPPDDVFAVFEDSTPKPPEPKETQDPFASFTEASPPPVTQGQTQVKEETNLFSSSFENTTSTSIGEGTPFGSMSASSHTTAQPAPPPAQDEKLVAKLAVSEEKLTLMEKEKLRIQKDHDTLVRAREDLERQLNEQTITLSQQKQRFEEMETRHKSELEQVRGGGHSALAMIVEQYKEQSRLTVEQQQDRSEKLLQEAVTKERERSEQLLREQHERLSAALTEEREKQEEKIGVVLQEAQKQHQDLLTSALEDAQRTHERKLEECLESERVKSRAAIEEAANDERKKTAELLEEIKKSHMEEMDAEREKAKQEMSAAIEQERLRSKELLSEALQEERERSEAAVKRAAERTSEQVREKMEDVNKHQESVRQRHLASLDLFLESARAQLQNLLSSDVTSVEPAVEASTSDSELITN